MRRPDRKTMESRRKEILQEIEALDDLKREVHFERGDFLALLIAAFTTILPVVLAVLLLYYIIAMVIFT